MKKPLTAVLALLATGLLTACAVTNANDGMQGQMMQGDMMQNCHKMMAKCHAMMKDGKMSPEIMKNCQAMMQDNHADDAQTSAVPADKPISAADHKKHHQE